MYKQKGQATEKDRKKLYAAWQKQMLSYLKTMIEHYKNRKDCNCDICNLICTEFQITVR